MQGFVTDKIQRFLMLFRRVSTCILKVAHTFRGLTALKPMKLNLTLQTWNLLVFVARLRERKKYFM